jgi:hypothetical protein
MVGFLASVAEGLPEGPARERVIRRIEENLARLQQRSPERAREVYRQLPQSIIESLSPAVRDGLASASLVTGSSRREDDRPGARIFGDSDAGAGSDSRDPEELVAVSSSRNGGQNSDQGGQQDRQEQAWEQAARLMSDLSSRSSSGTAV